MVIPRILFFDDIDSTNRIARECIAEGCLPGTVVLAGKQSSGRGQYGRAFSSPAGGLYFSLVLQPDLRPEFLPLITLATGLACHDVILAETGIVTMIKWPNDLYLADRKVAGILCESIGDPQFSTHFPSTWVIIGLGLNVNSGLDDFPFELQQIVTTLRACSSQTYDLDSLLRRLVAAIVAKVDMLRSDRPRVLSQWQEHDFLFDKAVAYFSGQAHIEGIGQGVGLEGGYRLRDCSGKLHTIIGGQLKPLGGRADMLPP